MHEVDLLKGGRHGGVARQRRRHIHRPELTADATRTQPRYVGLQVRLGVGDVELAEVVSGPGPHLPGEIVVPIDQGMGGEQVTGSVQADAVRHGVSGIAGGGNGHVPSLLEAVARRITVVPDLDPWPL